MSESDDKYAKPLPRITPDNQRLLGGGQTA